MSLADEKYVSTTTFRKSGVAVASATWIVALDNGRVGFFTSSASGKAKRLRNDPRVMLTPSTARGKVKADAQVTGGTAALVTSGPDFDAIHSKVKAKYGVMVPISRFFNKLGHIGKGPFPYGDLGVVIGLDD